MNFLLNDETIISEQDYSIRKKLYDKFSSLPQDFLSKMRHLQPQVGCFNNCSFCSKSSVCKSEFWNEKSLRNIISALKYSAMNYTKGDLLLAWDRKEHRIGVTFPYLNNDIAGYYYLDKYIELCYKELGIRTRISTVGFSRHNKRLNEVHKKICNSDLLFALAGVRLSITQYGRVWEDEMSKTSLSEYEKDLSNFLSIYKPYYNIFGSGARKMCVELRFSPLVVKEKVFDLNYNNHKVIIVNNYMFVSQEKNIILNESHIIDPYMHSLKISEDPKIFNEYSIDKKITTEDQVIEFLDNNLKNLKPKRKCELYLFKNRDGYYYAINPRIDDNGNYGINIYIKTEKRPNSGYLITERFFLNALCEFKKKKGLRFRDKYELSTWNDVEEVYNICNKIAIDYKSEGKLDKFEYVVKHILPIIKVYKTALKEANYSSDCFFDSQFTIDTGTICNLGRAYNLFKDITNYINEPLTPTHERNYGRFCSTMKQENYSWKLGCGYNDTLEIEKLELFNTASDKGQVSFKETIKIDNINNKIFEKSDKYLYPGVKK